jgi:hypothetical protein
MKESIKKQNHYTETKKGLKATSHAYSSLLSWRLASLLETSYNYLG